MELPLFPKHESLDWQFCDCWRHSNSADDMVRAWEDPDYDLGPIQEFIDCETGVIRVSDACPLCLTPLEVAYYDSEQEGAERWTRGVLGCCPNCLHWEWSGEDGIEGEPEEEWHQAAMISKLRTFPDLPAAASSELAQALRAGAVRWGVFDSSTSERLVGDVLRANYAPCEVIPLGRSHDRGIDLLFVDSGEHQHIVQVKWHQRGKPSEGAPTVRSLLGAIVQAGQRSGILVSNAVRFTREAKLAVVQAWRNYRIWVDLVDRGKLDRMLDPLMPKQPWRGYVASFYPESVQYFAHAFPMADWSRASS